MLGHATASVAPVARHRALSAAATAATVVGLFAALAAPARTAGAQYFGRNKVNYETFDFRVIRTPTFDVHYYPAESTATADMSRAAERWYSRLRPFMRHQFNERKTIVFFADQPDFQQNNITQIESEGTGGVTEGARQRVVMPHTGTYFDTHHVLGHELVHVFQYDIAANQPAGGGAVGLNALPLWLVEGMAEYLSLGRDDSNTAMWLRDAARRNDIPSIKQLTTDPRYFPYRYGQALWAYVGGRYGDQAVVDVYRTSLRAGFEGAIRRVLDVSTEQLSKDWANAIKDAYLPLLAGRTVPDSTGTVFLQQRSRRGGEYNVAPAVSADGRRVAFYSSRDLFGIEVYIADVETGRVIKQLGSVNTPRHFDALSFIQTAGSWAPDGNRLAYVVYKSGDQKIAIYDVARGREERILETPESIGAATDPAWSPDGRYVAFVGMVGGISDLFLYDLETNQIQRLTNDREAQLQPAWSPDGRTLVYVTDAGPQTNFDTFTFGPMRLGTIDVASRRVALLPLAAPGAKHVNPQFSPDGRSVYFVSDRTGFSDVYRLELASSELFQVTNTTTGISGISSLSPALAVARQTGRLVFSVFDRAGYDLARIDGAPAQGRSVGIAGSAGGATVSTGVDNTARAAAPGGVLPPFTRRFESVIERYLADAATGLPRNDTTFAVLGYKPSLRLDYIAPPQFGVSAGGPFGTQYGGGIAAAFSDQLGNRNLVAVVQAQGDIQDIGAQLQYINVRQRWNWGVIGGHVAYPQAYQFLSDVPQGRPGAFSANTVLQRIYVDQVGGLTQYPFSPTRRVEAQISATRQSFRQDVYSVYYDQVGNPIAEERTKGTAPPALAYAQGTLALVGDYSIFGFTSPIAGARYRFDVTPSVGEVTFTQTIADYRRYFLARPVTFAFRGLHYGRYGRDAENYNLLYPLFLGFEQWIRGYDYNSFNSNECRVGAADQSRGPRATNPTAVNQCPVINRLFGSRAALVSAELRIPLLGIEGLGLIRTNILPVEIAPFVDAGVAWNAGETPNLRFVTGNEASMTLDRVPVVTAGLTARFNLFGYAVVEAYYAYPFQRPDKGAHFGFQLAPGW